MTPQLEAEILAASQVLRLPGTGDQRVLSPVAVERLAETADVPRWQVEAVAMELEVVPLHYLRNRARFDREAQVRLLRSRVVLVGRGPVLARAAELLAANGVGRLDVLVPAAPDALPEQAQVAAEWVGGAARNRNTSSATRWFQCSPRQGEFSGALAGADVVAACLLDSMEEQLLQFACRKEKAPLVLAGIEEQRGQATTIFPGDPGVALIYKPRHPHLEPQRSGTDLDGRAVLMGGAWLAEQATAIIVENGELLRGRLLYADLATGEMTEYPL